MDTLRTVQWGHWGITFLQGGAPVHRVYFPVGPSGPVDGLIGSSTRKRWEEVAAAWVGEGKLPR